MHTTRSSKTTTISLPPSLYRDTITMAREKGMTRSELVREALRRYQREEREWMELLDYGTRKASKSRILDEAGIERLVDAERKQG